MSILKTQLDRRSAYKIIGAGILTCMALAVFVSTLAKAAMYSSGAEEGAIVSSTTAENLADQPASDLMPAENPARLIIPSLSLNAEVQKVGVTSQGKMANPSNFTDVGWYKYGSVPGQPGNAVLAGHVDNGLSLAGVFKRLKKVGIGDEIFVTTENGSRIRFIVTGIDTYPYDATPAEEIFSGLGSPKLKLITCDGDWISGEETYDQRVVVTASLAV